MDSLNMAKVRIVKMCSLSIEWMKSRISILSLDSKWLCDMNCYSYIVRTIHRFYVFHSPNEVLIYFFSVATYADDISIECLLPLYSKPMIASAALIVCACGTRLLMHSTLVLKTRTLIWRNEQKSSVVGGKIVYHVIMTSMFSSRRSAWFSTLICCFMCTLHMPEFGIFIHWKWFKTFDT